MFRIRSLILANLLLWLCVMLSCKKDSTHKHIKVSDKPNIILILADDVGYEVPAYTGGQSYVTPTLDSMAAAGIQFTQCYVCPNCSPTRNELITGKYNFRNYKKWGILNPKEKTIANMLYNAGYTTCVAGKWQFDGGDASIRAFGFEKYRVWLPFVADEEVEEKYRHKNPKLYENSNFLPQSATNGKYAEDMFVDYISDFIDENKNTSFFIYYPMSLPHDPFSPTPDDPEFASWEPLSNASNPKFYPSMINYMDKKVNQVINKVKSAGLSNKTIIMFLADNGTPPEIKSRYKNAIIKGGKSNPTVYGTHVPLLINWDGKISGQQISDGLIDAADFLPTIADIADIKKPSNFGKLDGTSFYSLLSGSRQRLKDWIYCYWNPAFNVPERSRIWVQDDRYKLYDATNNNYFFNIIDDPYEKKPLQDNTITPAESARKQVFQSILLQIR